MADLEERMQSWREARAYELERIASYEMVAKQVLRGMTRFMQGELMRRPCRSIAEPRLYCLPTREQSAKALIRRELLLRFEDRLYRVTPLGRAVRRKIAEANPLDYYAPDEY